MKQELGKMDSQEGSFFSVYYPDRSVSFRLGVIDNQMFIITLPGSQCPPIAKQCGS